ncbi:beta-ketoacyl-ACP synthase 3 [Tichowtungia aerotolerans]|uniref:3-methyl-2-oxobutanoate dehydrogenase (2-methylpropanoyl-transferring) n=1 Tax=Tichowtungia aerotolerans TaxID=2697043 RepID=A0A6P1M371_9BACT|nr:beta-ketoacyl-ACP synthase 3 [Tichowtungia aerotolerans]QHI68271.1 beta-ketoacyl-ACP synthase 3 [Tichowtungia aerotolerans]
MQKQDTDLFLSIYRNMLASRKADAVQEDAAQRGEAFFYIPSSGHEAMAALAPHLTEADWLHCHYRDRALMLARGVTLTDVLLDLLGKSGSPSEGRRMPAFANSHALRLLSAPTCVANNALQAVGVAQAVKAKGEIVYCGIGDGGTQEGEYLEAIAEAVRSELPVLFVVQNNKYALSTLSKGRTFFSRPDGDADEFYGIPILRCDGTNAVETHAVFGEAVSKVRKNQPQIVVMDVERLMSHTNADDHSLYRSAEDIREMLENSDPILILAEKLIEAGIPEDELKKIEHEINHELDEAFTAARKAPICQTELHAKKPIVSGKEEQRADGDALTMIEAMRSVIRARLDSDPDAYFYGEDIEDPKGDVFGLTRGVGKDFPKQVVNSPLSEATIVGAAIGQSLTGKKPVACIQFVDFMLPAFNQIAAELGAMWWRTNGQWECPVTVMAICGGYRPGLGPYHAQTFDATFAHIPGLDVLMPSTAADAAGLLNASFESGRPTIFLFPKNLINDRSVCCADNAAEQFVPIGKARVTRPGKDLTIVSWGSTMPLCEKTADALEEAGAFAELIDLRSLSPWDQETVLSSAQKTGKLLVVHEDNHTCGLGGEILATVAEKTDGIKMARVARADTYIPYHFESQIDVLPSFKSVLTQAAELTGYSLEWQKPVEEAEGMVTVNAIGSSPSDKTVTITELQVEAGQAVQAGDILASVEADKATMEISTPVDGIVEELLLEEGDSVDVGTPLARIKTEETDLIKKPVTSENPGTPILEKLFSADIPSIEKTVSEVRKPILLSSISTVLGARKIVNEDLVNPNDEWDSAAIQKRTGIETRYWIDGTQDVTSMAVQAVRDLLAKERLEPSDIDALVCSTGTPTAMTPSLACRVLRALSPEKGELLMQAHDVNAACSGYMYALQNAVDILRDDPSKKVIVITAETLSPMINHDDPKTSVLFGDAATASLLSCEPRQGNINALVNRPVLSAKGVADKVLYVPNMGSEEKIAMEGLTVFKVAVKKMIDMLSKACADRGIAVDELDQIVPHQANERIIEAIRKTIKYPPEKMFNHICKYANTSSNTIPFALTELMPQLEKDARVGLTAFGGGFTFGAAVIEKQ